MSGEQGELDARVYTARLERSLRKFDAAGTFVGGADAVRAFVARLDHFEAAELVRWFEGEAAAGPLAEKIRKRIVIKWKSSRKGLGGASR